MTNTAVLSLNLGARSYDIAIGPGLISAGGPRIAEVIQTPRAVIVTDDNVAPLWLDKLQATLSERNIHHDAIILLAGEQTKSFSHLETLVEDVLALGIDRKTTLIALGGGVIGDITGFAAAVTLRGLDFIQIPTTLLAQVDSSVGGKTGINTRHGKNLAGAFHQPRLVLADTDSLRTLPRRELLAGYAEVVKYGLIDDPDFFSWCEENGSRVIDGDEKALIYAVEKSCRAKARIVSADETEQGQRALLNLGHTFGHALEAEVGYDGRLLHGEAVAIGMLMAFELSNRIGVCNQGDVGRIRDHFERVGLKTSLSMIADSSWNAKELVTHMYRDKKTVAGSIAFVLAEGIGKSHITRDISETDVEFVLDRFLDGF